MKKVLAGGRFNIIHPGHIHLLKVARSLGDFLVVVIASDTTVKKSRKPLLFPENERKKMVASIQYVDKAVIGYGISGPSGYERIIRKEKPDVIALGYDQKVDEKQLKAIARKAGVRCSIARIKNYKGYATKKIMKRRKAKK